MKLLPATVVCVSLLFPSRLHAQCLPQIYTDPKDEPDYTCPGPGEDALVPKLSLKASITMKLGDMAPWAGILMDKDRVLSLGLRIRGLRRLRWIETVRYMEMWKAEKDFLSAMYKTELRIRSSQRDFYKKQVIAARKDLAALRKWYRSPFFWFSAGVVITSATVTGIVLGIK